MKISNAPLISVITINYNNEEVTSDFLRSLHEVTYNRIEVIVVDNASDHFSEENLKAIYPKVKIIRSATNLGFAGGNNLAVDIARGELLFFVNNDTELTPDIFQGLIKTFHNYANAGAVSPKFHYFFHPDTIEYAGYKKVNPFTGRNRMVGCKEKDNGQHDVFKETNYTHGGGMMVPAYVVKEVGKMPEDYFLYYEEFDWCEQIKRHGYKVYYQPQSLIYHKESMSVGKTNVLKTYYLSRNRILFMRRNNKGIKFLPFLIYMTTITIPKNILSYLFKKEYDHMKAFWRGIAWNLKNRSLGKA